MNRIQTNSDHQIDDALHRALVQSQQPIEHALSLPASCYHAAEIAHLETTAIFHRHWLGLGRADRFTENGQFETLEIAGVPLLLILGSDGRLRAFNNACRHRGARLLNGKGHCRGIRCPFHSWHYSNTGELISAPHMQDSQALDIAHYGLKEFALQVHAGFLFVCFHAQPLDFALHIGDFARTHSSWPLEQLVSIRRQRLEVECNWKLFLDVFNEYYHLPFVHPDSINSVYRKPEPAEQTKGHYASQYGENEGSGGLLSGQQAFALPAIPGLRGRARNGTIYTWLYPNMTFAASTDALWIYEAYPVDAQRCIAYQTLCFPQESLALPDFESRVEYYYRRFDAAVEEDRIALENQQRGLASPFTVLGPYAPGLEPNVAAFARWYANQLLPS